MSRLLRAPAKVNLSLRIVGGGRRTQGALHKIESQVVFLELHDRLEVDHREDAGDLDVKVLEDHGIEGTLPVCKNHSLARAARALAAALGLRSAEELGFALGFSWNIVLRKAIPAGAGLGGGSSDAASFLRYAREQLVTRGVSLSQTEWLAVTREVGSDVALFFLRAGSHRALVSGFGERVAEQASLPLCGVVLLCGAGLSTAEVYRRYASEQEGGGDVARQDCLRDAGSSGKIFSSSSSSSSSSFSSALTALLEGTGNDLLAAACALDGSIVERLSALRSCEEVFCARMTGSGSACFGLTALGSEEGVAARLRARGWRGVIATRFLSSEAGDEAGNDAGHGAGESVDKARGGV